MLPRMEPVDIQQLPFPMKLHNIIEKEPNYIHWSKDGKTFQIFDTGEFVRNVLPRHFRTARMASFTRNLNIYGFRKLSKGRYAGCYYHPEFTRNGFDKIKGMKRYVNGTKPSFFYVEGLEDEETTSSPTEDSTSQPNSNRKRGRTPSHENLVNRDCQPTITREGSIGTNLSQQLQPVQQSTQQQGQNGSNGTSYPLHYKPDMYQADFSVSSRAKCNRPARPSLSTSGFVDSMPAPPAAPPSRDPRIDPSSRRETLFEADLQKRRASFADIFGCMDYGTSFHRFQSDPLLDPLSPLGFTPHASGSMSPAVNAIIDQYYKQLNTKDLYAPKADSPKAMPK